MYVRLAAHKASVEEADDLKRLSVVTALDGAQAGAELRRAGLGDLVDGSAHLDVAALHSLAASRATTAGWQDGWETMIAYAAAKGWVSEDGRHLIAHLERA